MSPSTVMVSGVGQISALGQGIGGLREGLAGRLQPQRTSRRVKVPTGEIEVDILAVPAVTLPTSLPEAVQRRMPKVAKMFFSAALEALSDAFPGQSPLQSEPARMGLVVGSAFAGLDLSNQFEKRLVLEGPSGASPNLFATSVQNAIASSLSLSLGIQGPSSTVNAMEHTTASTLRVAYDWILQGKADHVLVLVGDEVSDMHVYALAGRETQGSACDQPLGEGVVGLVLSAAPKAGKKYAALSRVELYDTGRPFVGRRLTRTHEALYGTSLTGSAFEILTACLLLEAGGEPSFCVQTSWQGESTGIQLEPAT